MKTSLPPRSHWAAPAVWSSTATAAPVWGTVSFSQLPVRELPKPLPGYQLQVLLRLRCG